MPSFPALLSTGTAYVAQGPRRIYIVPSIANPASPTRAELTAGTDVSQNVTAMSGWAPNQNFANRSVIGSATVGQIAGTANFPAQSLSFEAGANSVDVRALLVWTQPPTATFVVILPEGDIPTTSATKMNVFKVLIGVVAPQNVFGDTESQIDVAFGVLSANMGVTIPANP
jgi:hypothetical protein